VPTTKKKKTKKQNKNVLIKTHKHTQRKRSVALTRTLIGGRVGESLGSAGNTSHEAVQVRSLLVASTLQMDKNERKKKGKIKLNLKK
jgi:hypothetical protein